MDNAEVSEETGRNYASPPDEIGPAAWVRTEDLECEPWNAIAEEFSRPTDEVTDCDDEEDPLTLDEEYEDEEELRCSLFRQLADLRPDLADLLSAPKPPLG